ncbi:zinc-dependent alcohol dehydrogenase family protein [Prolixibacteraceae bacterium Z1-6]|uniref:Zinc-dependent alcohol dehydrogenase family protein n=1 Tax=Draconibacterium aestuarii TaxID=2998507 RepID=A0A9X3F8S7_9BACT|nr:zinc-dependent alcohol dehydrogenase family protein [Prolixibacteraceae bacterium Z1-6]
MKAWVIDKISDLTIENQPLKLIDLPKPTPKEGELLLKVKACGVCHTEIDEIEGRTPPPTFPIVPGHQVVGEVIESKGIHINTGTRVGVAWIFSTCGKCEYCLSGRENLCNDFIATGRDKNGGYAEFMVVPEKFAYPIPEFFSDVEAAPLLCAGAIGYRSVSLCNLKNGHKIGLTGFGASAHLVLKLVQFQYPKSETFVFARNKKERDFAMGLGAKWAGDTTDKPPSLFDCIIDTTPAWKPIVHALEFLKPGGRLVINAIRKESIDTEYLLNIDYPKHLWMEKEIKSVANVTCADVTNFISIAEQMKFKPEIQCYSFKKANKAIMDIKKWKIKGAKVLVF